jgi:hypothetical protein
MEMCSYARLFLDAMNFALSETSNLASRFPGRKNGLSWDEMEKRQKKRDFKA